MKARRLPRFLCLNRPSPGIHVPVFEAGSTIPKLIHQIYFNFGRDLPSDLATATATLRAKNPGWVYRLYDDHDISAFIQRAYGADMLRTYFKINEAYGAARADFFRYLLMYKCGGVYLDIKSSATPALDDIIQPGDRLILSQWSKSPRFEGAGIHDWELADLIDGGEIQQWHIICAPGHPYLRHVIQNVIRNIRTYTPGLHPAGATGVLTVTGPIAYTLALLPLLPQAQHRFVKSHEDLGLIYSIFDDNKQHARLFTRDYKTLSAPVIHATWPKRSLAALYRAFNTLREWRS